MELYNPNYDIKEKRTRILDNILKMLVERKWVTPDKTEEILRVLKQSILRSHLKIEQLPGDIKEIHLYFVEDRSFFRKKYYEKLANLERKDNRLIILVNNEKLIKVDKELKKRKNVEIWLDNDFLFNIIEHVLVPKHKLLTKTEKDKFFNDMKNQPKDTEKIPKNDRISRYYKAEIGDIFEIERPNEQSGIETAWRIVVASRS